MAYQNVGGSPRFFIDNYRYLRASGLEFDTYTSGDNFPDDYDVAFGLDGMRAKAYQGNGNTLDFYIPLGQQSDSVNNFKDIDYSNNMKFYCAILNHRLGTNNYNITGLTFADALNGQFEIEENPTSVLNFQANSQVGDGTTIMFTDLVPTETMKYGGFRISSEDAIESIDLGAISMGVMFTMPNSPDLDITMNVEMGGFDSVQTLGGSEIVNIRNTGAPYWENNNEKIMPFGVGSYYENVTSGCKRNGRRTWSMKFTHISDSDVFSSNYMKSNYVENSDGYDSDDITENEFNYNIFTDDSFIAQVCNKTLGCAVPFIFQPDSTNNNPDQFCIAKFDMDSLSVKQVAFKSYEISLKIREVW